jgi:hypothetical protein
MVRKLTPGEYVNFHTYYYRWRRDFSILKVSWLVKDICPYCYVFANCHRYLVNCGRRRGNDGGNDGYNNEGEQGNGNSKQEQDDLNTDDKDCDNGNKATNLSSHGMTVSVDLNPPEMASTEEDKEREPMILEAAEHIKMARAQRALYQAKVDLAV